MTLKFTILGCGFSGGIPRAALGWGDCDPNNPKNRRRRTSLLIEKEGANGKKTSVLVDSSPDLREQLYDAGVMWLDAVLYTHPHADHVHGIDDLRGLYIHKRRPVDVYMDEPTSRDVRKRFDYCFATQAGSEYPPIVIEHRIAAGQSLTINGEGGPVTVMPFLQDHGDIPSLGFRFGGLAYSCDLSGLRPESIPMLAGLEIWIVDALRYKPHPSHFSLSDSLSWIGRIKPQRAVLTNLHSDLDYEVLKGELPPHVEPGYDGISGTVSEDSKLK